MASSKTIVLFGLLFAIVLLISFEVSARELAQKTQSQESVEEANCDNGYGPGYSHERGGSYGLGGGGGGYGPSGGGGQGGRNGGGSYGLGGGGRGGRGKPGHGGHPPEETEDIKN